MAPKTSFSPNMIETQKNSPPVFPLRFLKKMTKSDPKKWPKNDQNSTKKWPKNDQIIDIKK